MNPSDFGADIFDADRNPGGEPAGDDAPTPSDTGKKKKARRTRRKATADETDGPPPEATVSEAASPEDVPPEDVAPDAAAPEPAAPEPAARDHAARSTSAARAPDAHGAQVGSDAADDADDTGAPPVGDEAPPGARRKRRRKKKATARRAGTTDDDRDDVPGAADRRDAGDREVPFGTVPESDEPDFEDGPSFDEGPNADEAVDLDAAPDARRHPDDERDREDERGGRRRRRRRRRGDRDDDVASEDDGPPPRREPTRPVARTDRMIPVPTPEGEVRGQRVAILFDLDAMIAQARDAGGEVAFGKLLQRIARRRHLIRAIAYADHELAARTGTTLRGCGIELHAVAGADDLPVALAVDAMALARRVDSVVIAPDARRVTPLAAALRAQGVRVETASFTATDRDADDDVQTRHELGAESLFVP